MSKQTGKRPILPACLLVEGRACLVVGGGKIAARKIGHLLDAGAEVTVVSPTAEPGLLDLAGRGRIRHVAREFTDSDLQGQYLAFAVTNDAAVNRGVIEACRARDILCSAADGNWPDGDLIMPAICRESGVVVTVATGGRSCRLARVIKDRLRDVVKAIIADQDDLDPGSEGGRE